MKDDAGAAIQELLTTSLLHDLKNQSHHLVVGLEQLTVADDVQPRLHALQREAASLGDQLTDVLLLLRLAQQRHGLQNDLRPVRPLLERVAQDARDRASGLSVSMEVSAADDLLHFFDETLVESVLRSACDNALRHAKSRVRLSATQEKEFLHLVVEDNGAGYPPALADPLSSGKAKSADLQMRRSGLGLMLADEVARVHQNGENTGSLTLGQSTDLGGARFCITLP